MNTGLIRNILTGTAMVLLLTSCDTDWFKQFIPSAAPQKTEQPVEKKVIEAPKEAPIPKEIKPATTAEKKALIAALKAENTDEKSIPQFIPNTLKIKQHPKDPNSLFAKLKTKTSEILNIDLWSKKYEVTGIGLCGTSKVAIINKKTILLGEEISDGVLLKDVSITYVTILHEGAEYLIRPKNIQALIDNNLF